MESSRYLHIAGRRIGPGEPVYCVAEMSANHNQDFDEAVRIIRAAKDAGADAVKIQTYRPDTITIDCDNEHFRIKGTIWNGKNLFKLYGEAFTPWDWQPKLQQAANELGLHLFSSPFDRTAVDFLEAMNVPAYKIASFEIVDIPLIRYVARTGKPVIISTGMSTIEEIKEAVEAVHSEGNNQVALLKCSSAYPAPPEEMNLRTISDLGERFGVPVGLSDHTLGIGVPVAAVSLGACLVEKHFTLSRQQAGPDSSFSLEPQEFSEMVKAVRTVQNAMGEARYGVAPAEKSSYQYRRSLFVVEDVRAGEAFTEKNVRSIRPGNGLHPRHMSEVLGRRATSDISRGTPLAWSMVEGRAEAMVAPKEGR